MFYIAVFRSQTQTYAFKSLLESYGINASVIQTPRQAEVSCGLSVKFMYGQLDNAKAILQRRSFSSFVGIFLVKDFGNGVTRVMQVR